MTTNNPKLRADISSALASVAGTDTWPAGHLWADVSTWFPIVLVGADTVKIGWNGLPHSADVVAAVTPLLDGPSLIIDHRWAWSDGRYYRDAREAYLARHGHELETVDYDGCGHCDGHVEESAEDAYDRLVAAGEDLTDARCVPGRFQACPGGCFDGRLSILAGRVADCPVCAPNVFPGVVNVDDPDELARYTACIDRARATLAEQSDAAAIAAAAAKAAIPSVEDWVALRSADAADDDAIVAAVRRLLGADRKVLTAWLDDPSTR